nr:putative reverse transcriptase, RNA-dependent DNA polymerase [Tanacetum cinerariifolium]
MRVKKLERRNKGRMIAEMDQDDPVVLEDDKEKDMEVADVVKDVEEAKVDETDYLSCYCCSETVTAASAIITTADAQVPTTTLTDAPARVAAALSRRRKGAVIQDPEEESTTSTINLAETKSKDKGKGMLVEEPKPLKKKRQIEQDEQYARELHANLNKDIDWDEAIDHVKRKAKEDHAVKIYQVLKRKPQTEAQARKNMMMYLKNVAGFKMDYFKGMSYNDICPIFEAKFNSNVAFLLKTKEQIKEDENRALQKINETPTERAAKRRKLDEESWKNQRTTHGPAKVKGWKLLESCGVQIINFTSTQLILLVERKSHVDPTLLNDFEMATNGNDDDLPPLRGGDLPVPNLQTMEELCQPTLNGRDRSIAPIAIQATNFGLKNDMIQQVQNSCQFHGLSGDDANKHLDKFLHVTQSIKVNGVTDDALRLYLFPHSLTHHAIAWFDHLPRNSINTFEQMAKMFLGKYFSPFMVTKLRNEITNFHQRPDEFLFEAWECYKLSIDRCPNHNMLPVTQIDTFYNGLTLRHRDTINVAAGETFMKRRPKECYDLIKNMTAYHNDWDTSIQWSKSSSSITSSFDLEIVALKAEMAEINKNLMKPPLAKPRMYMLREPIIKGLIKIKTKAIQIRTTKIRIGIKETIMEFLRGTTKKVTNPSKELVMVKTRLQLSLPGLSPTCMTLKLADRLISYPVGVTEDVFVKVGTFHFLVDFIVVDFDADPQVPLILGRSFLKTGRALIDVYEEELMLRVGKEAEVLGFYVSGNPTPSTEPIVSNSSPTLTPFGDNGDILLLEEFLNDDPSSPPLTPQDLKVVETTNEKSSIDEPPVVKLKDLPPHLEYAFLEGDDKLAIIIAKDLKDELKTALIMILMEDDFKPAVQHQRRVNLKIHEVIKKEIKSSGGVFTARKPLIFLRLSTMGPPGDIMARTTPPKRERFRNGMKCLKIPSKFSRFLTFRASISWGHSRLHEGTSIYSWPFGTPRVIISDCGTHFCNDQLAKVMLKYGVTHRLATAYHPQTSGQVEVFNHGLKRILERNVGENRKANEGFLVLYAAHSKAYRVYNLSSKKVKETLNLRYLEDKPNIKGLGQEWYFDLDYLTDSLGYTYFKPNPPAGTPDTNIIAGTQDDDSDSECDEQAILVPSFPSNSFSGPKVNAISASMENNLDYAEELVRLKKQEHEAHSIAAKNLVLAAGDPAGSSVSTGGVPAGSVPARSVPTSNVPAGGVLAGSIDSAGFGNPAANEFVPAVFNPDHAADSTLPPGHSLGSSKHSTRFPSISDLGNHQPTAGIFSSSSCDDEFCADVTNLALSVGVDHVATKRVNTIHPQSHIIRELYVAKALEDPDWVATMQEEMQQFYNQQVWKLVPLHDKKIAIETKWILKNKRDVRGIVVRNKARLVAQGHRQEEGIDYDEVFAPVARIEAIRLFLAFASYMGFMVYVDDIIFGSTNKAWCDEFEVLMKGEFEMSVMGELTFFLGLQVKQLPDGIFISQDKYIKDMLKKFDMESVRTRNTPYEVPKPKSKDEPDDAVNIHPYRSMIGSLMYLTASRPDIIFAVSACSRHQVTQMTSHLNAVKKIFKYLKGQPHLGLWYPRDSPFQLEAYSDSDYDGSHVVATSFIKVEYVAAASCCDQRTICIVKNLVFHQRTKHIEIRHHFIRDAHEKRLVQVLKIHINDNVADLLTKAFDGPRFNHLVYQPSLKIIHQHKLSTILQQSSMATLKYKEEHNKVGYLLKPTGSDDYHQIIDFLSTSHIRAPELGPLAILATIDNTPYTISEELVRSRLQLADDGHVTDLPISKIYSGMVTLGYVTEENVYMGTAFHTSPLRSSHTPPTNHRSGGMKDPITLMALSSVVSTLTKKRKMVVSDSDEEEGTTPNVNLEALRALANAAVANDSDATIDVPAATSPTPPGTSGVATGTTNVTTGTTEAATSTSGVATGTTGVAAGATRVIASASRVGAGPSSVAHSDSTGSPGGSVTPTADSAVSTDSLQVPPGASNKGKSPMIEKDIPVPASTFRQMEEDRLGEEVARQLHEEELAKMEREREEAHRKR